MSVAAGAGVGTVCASSAIWTTSLGGGLGIHGHGAGSDWTAGCVALDDHDVEELFNVLRLGDPVEILP